MAGLKKLKSASLVALCATMLVGFSGQEKQVEQAGDLNPRSTRAFLSNDSPAGLRLPSNAQDHKRQIANVENEEDTLEEFLLFFPEEGAFKGTPFFLEPSAPTPQQAAEQTVDLIERTNSRTRETGQASPPTTPECVECSSRIETPKPVVIYPARKERMAGQCSKIMDNRGRLGPTGKSLISIMSEKRYIRNFTSPNAMGYLCPRFNTLTKTQKLQAWTWFWTSLGHEESGCSSTKVHRTTYRDRSGRSRVLNPREGYGIWAMERDRLVRRHRGAACNNISTAAGQARCSIDIMNKRQLSKGRTLTNDKGSYWGPVRRARTQLQDHMRRFNLCF